LTAGGASIGFFPTGAPVDSAFGTTITGWSTLLAAGYEDVRTIPGATLSSGFDWDFPVGTIISGTVSNIPYASLPQNTQLYLFAFDNGSFNVSNPSLSFLGSGGWAAVKDNADLSPADLGTRVVILSNVSAAEVLVGTDDGVNVRVVPEPSQFVFALAIAGAAMLPRRRRVRASTLPDASVLR
jgi:hypothetical protein